MSIKIEEFRKKVAQLPREEIIGLIRDQDPDLVKQIKRIEWVFENKLRHLTWNDGTPIEGRPLTNEELALILDPPFSPSRELRDMGFDRDVQEQIHISSDPVLWAKAFLGVNPRVYQTLILRDPSKRRVLRMGRRAGKTFCMAIMLLHYSYTTENGRCLIMAPMKTQVALVFDEVMKLAKQGTVIESIPRSITSPQHEINFTNGSTMRFFTTGLKSGGKADIARGQEAHLIILDEMDYMGIDDVNAIYAMLQKTSENQPDKMLIGASTPTGRREKFFEWCTQSKFFKEFYWPAYVNPLWTKEIEEEQRAEHTTEMHYRHEIEADWGEDAEGVYPRRYVDVAFVEPEWEYVPRRTSARSVYFMGVDWDKYRAGPNIVVLEACGEDYEDSRFANKLRMAYREEIPPGEYALTKAVDRVIELNGYFNPEHIYIDRGYGDCVSPDTLISTPEGVKYIKDIKEGDEVLSADGYFHKVTGKIVRLDAKATFRVKAAKCLPVEVSDTHPFFVLQQDGTYIWKNITELLEGDKVGIAKLAKTNKQSTIIDIATSYTPEYLESGPSKNFWGNQDIPKSYYYDDKLVWVENTNNQPPIKANRFIDMLSEDFQKFAGWYLSEGSVAVGNSQIEISQRSCSKEDLLEITSSIENTFGIKPKVYEVEDSRKSYYKKKTRVCFSCKPVADFIVDKLGRGSADKRLPFEMVSNYEQLGTTIRCILKGDGSKVRKSGFEISLTSFSLIDQLRNIFVSMELMPSIYAYPKREDTHKDQLKLLVAGGPKYVERLNEYLGTYIPIDNRINRSCVSYEEDFAFVPIRKIERIEDTRGLIDIEVEGGESFVGNGLLLHNTQLELLHKYGVENPSTGLKKKVRGIQFRESIEVRDPATKQMVKKEIKPYMVENLRSLLEEYSILFSSHDEELYMQLISYVVIRTSAFGLPVFGPSGSQVDHAHDALILACLAYTENYGDLHKIDIVRKSIAISNETFLPTFGLSDSPGAAELEKEIIEEKWGGENQAPVKRYRSGVPRRKPRKKISRKMF